MSSLHAYFLHISSPWSVPFVLLLNLSSFKVQYKFYQQDPQFSPSVLSPQNFVIHQTIASQVLMCLSLKWRFCKVQFAIHRAWNGT